MGYPVLPIREGFAQGGSSRCRGRVDRRGSVLKLPEDERGRLTGSQSKIGCDAGTIAGERMRSAESQLNVRRSEERARLPEREFVAAAGVVECRPAFHTEGHFASNAAYLASDFVPGDSGGRAAVNGHEVGDLANPVRIQEAGEQHVCFGKVHLAAVRFSGRGDAKETALLVIQYGGKDAGGIEVGKTTPIDGAVHPHQCHRVQVADNTIGADVQIRHRLHDSTGAKGPVYRIVLAGTS